MTRSPRDRDDEPFDEMFKLVEELMEQMTTNMDGMMGPFGSFDVEMNQHATTVESGSGIQTSETNVTVQKADDELRVVADLPGVSKDEIDIKSDGQTVLITTSGDQRTYEERLELPARVDEESASASYNNGILEVTFPCADSQDNTSIDIE